MGSLLTLHMAKKVIIIQTSYDRIAFYAIKQMHHTNAIECVYEIFHIHANKYLNVVQNNATRFQRKVEFYLLGKIYFLSGFAFYITKEYYE